LEKPSHVCYDEDATAHRVVPLDSEKGIDKKKKKITAPKAALAGSREPKEKLNPLLPLTPFSTFSPQAYLAEHRAGPQLARLEGITG